MRSIRALRQHGREPAKAKAVSARLADFRAGLKQIDQLLTGPGYSAPGTWAKQLTLGEKAADAVRDKLESAGLYTDTELRVPVATIFRAHIDSVLKENGGVGTDSLLGAVEETFAPGAGLTASWKALVDARVQVAEAVRTIESLEEQISKMRSKKQTFKKELALLKAAEAKKKGATTRLETAKSGMETTFSGVRFDAKTDKAKAILADLTAVLSMGARMTAEAAAVVPVVTAQAWGTLTNAHKNPKEFVELANLVWEAYALSEELEVTALGLHALAKAVASAAGQALSDTAGFQYPDSASDMIRGFAWDSFYFDLRAGGEVLFFHNAQRTGDEGKAAEDTGDITYDLSNQKQRLNYKVEPIVMAAFSLDAGLDLLSVPGLIEFDLGYKTDRVYQSGGSIERSDDALSALGASGAASDVLSAGLAIMGVRTAVESAHFNAGVVELVDAQTDAVIAKGPFELDRLKVDLTYDLLWVLDSAWLHDKLDTFDVGFRYMNYKLPRIVYEFEDRNGDKDRDDYVLIGESDPQVVESEFYMVGTVANGAAQFGNWLVPMGLGLYLGGGPSDFELPDSPDGKERSGDKLFSVIVPAHLGVAYAFGESRDRLSIDFELVYNAEFIFAFAPDGLTSDDESDLGNRVVDFGGLDIFHGPTANLRVNY